MKHNVILIVVLFFVHSTNQSQLPNINYSVLDFVKLSDSQELVKIVNLIEEEHTKLKINKENHLLMCEKSLHTCKIKFSNKMCSINNELEEKNLHESLQENIKNNNETKDMLQQVELLIRQNEEDCKNIEILFNVNEKQFDHDIKLVTNLIEGIKTKIILLKLKQNEKMEKDEQDQVQRLNSEREMVEKTLVSEKQIEKEIDKKKRMIERMLKKLYEEFNERKNQKIQKKLNKNPQNKNDRNGKSIKVLNHTTSSKNLEKNQTLTETSKNLKNPGKNHTLNKTFKMGRNQTSNGTNQNTKKLGKNLTSSETYKNVIKPRKNHTLRATLKIGKNQTSNETYHIVKNPGKIQTNAKTFKNAKNHDKNQTSNETHHINPGKIQTTAKTFKKAKNHDKNQTSNVTHHINPGKIQTNAKTFKKAKNHDKNQTSNETHKKIKILTDKNHNVSKVKQTAGKNQAAKQNQTQYFVKNNNQSKLIYENSNKTKIQNKTRKKKNKHTNTKSNTNQDIKANDSHHININSTLIHHQDQLKNSTKLESIKNKVKVNNKINVNSTNISKAKLFKDVREKLGDNKKVRTTNSTKLINKTSKKNKMHIEEKHKSKLTQLENKKLSCNKKNELKNSVNENTKLPMNDIQPSNKKLYSNSIHKPNEKITEVTNTKPYFNNKSSTKNTMFSSNNTTHNNSKIKNSTNAKKKLNSYFTNKIKKYQDKEKFLEIESKISDNWSKSKGFVDSIFSKFAQITQGLSLVQLSSGLTIETKFAQDAINKVESKLKIIIDLNEKLEYLKVTNNELQSIFDDLKQSKILLYNAFQESKSSCIKRFNEWNTKKAELRESFLASKLEVESLKKKILLYDSNKDLCELKKDNLKTCNELSDYCNNYQIEYSEELKELEDLMLYFNEYLDKL